MVDISTNSQTKDNKMDDFLESLRNDHGRLLTNDQHNHICGVIERFAVNAYRKYVLGVLEHGGGLLAKPVLHEMRDECIDLFIYTDTAIQQMNSGGVVPEPGWTEGGDGKA
jgi:hypothetical protein